MSSCTHGAEPASEWIRRWSHLVPEGGPVLDLAGGRGRHTRWFAAQGHPVTCVDRSQEALDALADLRGGEALPPVRTVCADVENGPWPLTRDGSITAFDGVVVTNYLWRALFPTITRSVAIGGALLYETFAHGNASVGKPSRPDFLLQPGELLQAFAGLRVVAYEDGYCADPPRFVQRIAAVREASQGLPQQDGNTPPIRYRL